MTRRVLSVGNCSFDHGRIERLISANFDAEVVAAASPDEALRMLATGGVDLALVNRILLADSSEGVQWIEQVKSDASIADTPVMLLSNYPEAQQAAVSAGAEPGFGKAELESPETIEKLARFLSV